MRERTEIRRERIRRRTEQLPFSSRVLYAVDHYTSMAPLAIGVPLAVVALIIAGAALDFPHWWLDSFQIVASALTLVMVFVIQHTQGREQAATQRKLDELIRATPQASERLIMVEEASEQELFEVSEALRSVKQDATEDES